MAKTTLRQRNLANNIAKSLSDNSEKETYKDLMLKSGYSEITAKEPHKILQGKGFQELMTNYGVTDKKLATRLNEGLDANKKDEIDYSTRHKYLETALELKGLKDKGFKNQLNVIGNDFDVYLE
jgi:hypothetical protein